MERSFPSHVAVSPGRVSCAKRRHDQSAAALAVQAAKSPDTAASSLPIDHEGLSDAGSHV